MSNLNGWNDASTTKIPLNTEIFALLEDELRPCVIIAKMYPASKLRWSENKEGYVLCYDVPVANYKCCNGSEIKYWKSVDKPEIVTDKILEKINKGIELNSCEKEYITKILTSINQNNDVFAIKNKSKPEYDTNDVIKIGNQVWAKKNLNLTDEGLGKDHWKDEKTGEVYYTWVAAKRLAKKVPGFHLPKAKEWDQLAEACGGVCRNPEEKSALRVYDNCENLKKLLKIKLVGSFSGSFYAVGSNARFWTSTESSGSDAYYWCFDTGSSMSSGNGYKYYGRSVRLVKDS